MKLIDKDALVADIKRRKDICKKVVWDLRTQENKDYYQGKAEAYNDVLSILDSMQEEPVSEGLEKELESIDQSLFDLNGVAVKGATHYLTVEDVKDIAKHFYELGIKAKKGK